MVIDKRGGAGRFGAFPPSLFGDTHPPLPIALSIVLAPLNMPPLPLPNFGRPSCRSAALRGSSRTSRPSSSSRRRTRREI